MQLIWVAGPTARVWTLSITRRTVLVALASMAGTFLVLGGLFQWIGLRVAVDHSPALVQKMGGVATLQEQQRMEAMYNARLSELQQQLGQTLERLQQMEASRQAFFARIGLGALVQPAVREPDPRQGRGGPFRGLGLWGSEPPSLAERLAGASGQLEQVQDSLTRVDSAWARLHDRLQHLPLALPIQSEFMISSTFGVRPDPLTHLPSMHEGLDFVAPVGTPVLVTAAGRVVLAAENGAYGKMVEVVHAEGFATRFAHLHSIAVQPGQLLQAGERVGALGNTGRSTGPHLHYEVLLHGQPMHPVNALQKWSRS